MRSTKKSGERLLEEVFFGLRVAHALVEGRDERLPVGRDALYQRDQD
jgi:hypothetical protein